MTASKAKSYGQSCSVARTLDVLGDRWSLLIIRELLAGPMRYSSLKEHLAGINPKLLSDRLTHLADFGIIEQIDLPQPARARAYALTGKGRELEETVLALARWGLRHAPDLGPEAVDHPHWSVVAMRALFNPAKAMGVHVGCQFNVGAWTLYAVIRDGMITSGIGQIPAPDIVITSDEEAFRALDGRTGSLERLVEDGRLQLTGGQAAFKAFEAFAACFDSPDEALARTSAGIQR